MQPIIESFFNEPTNTVSYLIADPKTGAAAVIDPVLDYDAEDGTVDTASAEAILAMAAKQGWQIELVLETHAHADHLGSRCRTHGARHHPGGPAGEWPTVRRQPLCKRLGGVERR